ncbi:DoxX family protein [Pseudoxanthomonas suwonensis]|uniref:DoxX family protein n=1 Tax=Pseudoxanthomonas suwonensis TaxID=314722 RepID=UPI0004AF36A2|nr:DoxX family protein [Pseudoxanthomonas suwonensis]
MKRNDDWLWAILRVTLAILVAAHGWARLLHDAVAPFGAWLDGQGLMAGAAIAWAVTGYEIVASVLLAAGRYVFPVCLGFAAIYLVGLVLVHLPEGWFVVGLGRNGMEYSVLLVCTLLCVGVHYRKGGTSA